MNSSAFDTKRANAYDQFIMNWFPDYQYILDLIPRLLNTYTQENKRILVAGCGSGNDILAFLNSEFTWEITGVDPSEEMLTHAMEKIPPNKGVKLIHGTLEQTITNEFGAATSILVMHFLPDDGKKYDYLKSLSNKLIQKAPLAIVDIYGNRKQLQLNLEYLIKKLPDYISDQEVNERIQKIIDEIQYIPEDRLNELLLETGFRPPLKFFNDTIYGGWITRKI